MYIRIIKFCIDNFDTTNNILGIEKYYYINILFNKAKYFVFIVGKIL